MKSQLRNKIIYSTLLLITMQSCTSSHGTETKAVPRLPASWIADDVQLADTDVDPEPGPNVDHMVKNLFGVHVEALDEIATDVSTTTSKKHAPGWTPWHLQALMPQFSISASGIVGVHSGAGNASIQAIWQKKPDDQKKADDQSLPAPSHANTVQFSSQLDDQSLDKVIEPVVQTAAQSKPTLDRNLVRQNLRSRAKKFLALIKLMENSPAPQKWKIAGLELGLSIGAGGEVTPVTSVGGQVLTYFDWVPSATDTTPNASTPASAGANSSQFSKAVSALLEDPILSDIHFQKWGLDLNQIQIGLTLTASGDVGVALASGTVIGKVLYQKVVDPSTPTSQSPSDTSAPILAVDHSQTATTEDPSDEIKISIDQNKIHKSLKRAVHRAMYFAKHAAGIHSEHWQLQQIYTEFDLSGTGSLNLTTVTGQGNFILYMNKI